MDTLRYGHLPFGFLRMCKPALRSVYTRVFCFRFSVCDGATAQLLPLLFTYVIAREKQRKQLGGGTIADGETDAKNASVDGPLVVF
jgi:hypothetical protein